MQESAYTEYNGKTCITGSAVIEAGIATLDNWKWWAKQANKLQYTTRPGGNGRPSLIELKAIPTKYREVIIETFGNPEKQFNALEEFFSVDGAARKWFDDYQHPATSKGLEPYQIARYTTNASVLNALIKLKEARELMTKRLGNARRDLKPGLSADCNAFNEVLKGKFGKDTQHTLPTYPRKLADKMSKYKREGYASLVDGRVQNTSAQVVTPEMIQLWNDIFAGQRHKPTHYEVSSKYELFLAGALEIVKEETGEVYERTDECFKPISDASVYNYLAEWKNRIGVFKARAGSRKTYMDRHTPSGRMRRPSPGAILSIDDLQPPFESAKGAENRVWFYIGQDLGSTAITVWVHGSAKAGIIDEFYRQLLRSYSAYGLNLPYELECEASLNSNFKDTFLQNGCMFQKVRILPNKPRAKRIERTIRDIRYKFAAKHEAFQSRPHAIDENFQVRPGKEVYLSEEAIIDQYLRYIEKWNNELHPDQDVYPCLTRWQVFMQHQNPKLTPTNWAGLLPHVGKRTPSSMSHGRITLQNLDRVVGFNGKVATGEALLNIMNEIEGQEVTVFWLDDEDGELIKAFAYNEDGRMICEILDDLPYHRSEIDRTEQCEINYQLYCAYEATVEGHASRLSKNINRVEIVEQPVTQNSATSFVMPGINRYEPTTGDAQLMDERELVPVERKKRSLKDRF